MNVEIFLYRIRFATALDFVVIFFYMNAEVFFVQIYFVFAINL